MMCVSANPHSESVWLGYIQTVVNRLAFGHIDHCFPKVLIFLFF